MELQNGTVYDQISKLARQEPEAIAIRQGARTLSYELLEKSSNQLANALITNIGENKHIVTFLDQSIELVQATVGIMKAGCVFVPIDSNYPKNRIRMIINKVEASWIVTTSLYLDKLQNLLGEKSQHIHIILMDGLELTDENKKLYSLRDYNEEAMVWERNSYSYICFTSGSTGTPKAILGKHRSLKHFIDWEIKEFGIDRNCIGSQLTSPSFDAYLRDVFVPLCAGGIVCIPESRNELLLPHVLKQWISINNITLIHIVPTIFRMLMNEVNDASSFPSLQYVFLAGELLRGHDVKKFLHLFENRIQLINFYGPSETTLIKAFYRIQLDDGERLTIPIGKPMNGAQLLILNSDMQESLMGSVGEIYIRTPYISAGYYKDKDLNAEVFIKNPFSNKSNDILYKTGDKGRLLSDGNYEIIGRVDNQIKINGIRIEPEEIENRIISYPDIKEAVVIGREDVSGSKYLCAYLVSEAEILGNEIRLYLLDVLPDYMIPTLFMQLEKLPLTPNGKIDRKALPALEDRVEGSYVAPRNKTEMILTEIWSEVLGWKQVGISDDFFELGGHSLKAASVLARIHKELNLELPLRILFNTPTIAAIGQYLLEANESAYAAIEPVGLKEYYTVSSAQKRIWFLQQLDQEQTSYNMPAVLIIDGDLDRSRLEHAFENLVQRHESLRTSFDLVNNVTAQRVMKSIDFKIDYLEGAEVEIDNLIKQFIRPFDLKVAPLLRVGLVKTAKQRHYLMLDMHHIISDGVSMAILTKEFMSIYGGQELAKPRIGYKDFSQWQHEYLSSERMKEQETYWIEQFSEEIPVLNLPLDYVRPQVRNFAGSRVDFKLDCYLTEKINSLASETRTTVYMVLLSAIKILLSKYTGQVDIIVGSPIAGRPHADLEGIIGMFVNTLVMRSYPKNSKTYAEFLEEVKEIALKAYENQDYQFEELVDKLNLRRDISRNPLFDVMFELQNMEESELELEGLKFTGYDNDQRPAKFDLTFTAIETKDEIVFSVEYGVNLFKRKTIERMASHLQNLIEIIVGNRDILLGDIKILSREELSEIMAKGDLRQPELTAEKLVKNPESIKRPPKSLQENILIEIWKGVLSLNEVYLDDDFFELGGNSLNIIPVVGEIQERLGVAIKISDLFVYTTIVDLAEFITNTSVKQNEYKHTFKINKSTSEEKIFLIHGGDADIFYYRHLAKILESKYTVYGIQPRGINGKEAFPLSFYEMIYDYVKEIKEIQPEGPYILGGYCIGAYLAYDITRVFELQGEDVKALLELDQEPFVYKKIYKHAITSETVLKIIELLRRILRKDKMFTFEKMQKVFERKYEISKERQREIMAGGKPAITEYFAKELMFHCGYSFFSRKVKTPTLIVKAEDNNNPLFETESWEDMAKISEFYEIPGNHENVLLPPYVDKMGEIVLDFLERLKKER